MEAPAIKSQNDPAPDVYPLITRGRSGQSGNAPLRGLTAADIGMLLAMIGSDPQTGTLRWTMDSLYLWEGLPLVPVVLGIFALPELADLFIRRTAIATGGAKQDLKTGMMMGVRDGLKHWWLVIRCSWIGAGIGAVPGMGGSVIDWLAYGHALKTEKGARETFGKGDVRGVIASESSNNAKEGGALVPTVAFGIPGSAGMAVLLGAFLIHGLVPGPDMLTKNLQVTYSMVWSIAIANILGAGLCFLFSGQFAKIATLRYSIILPVVLCIVYIGAFNGSRNWGDLYTLLICGVFGWTMKQMKWPRPPLILGFVIGDIIERYLFISMERYGTEWLISTSWENVRWAVLIIFAISIVGVARPLISDWTSRTKIGGSRSFKLKPQWSDLFTLVIIGGLALALSMWPRTGTTRPGSCRRSSAAWLWPSRPSPGSTACPAPPWRMQSREARSPSPRKRAAAASTWTSAPTPTSCRRRP